MEKYEQHGLTKAEDDVLGGFGTTTDVPREERSDREFTPEHRKAAKTLVLRKLLTRSLKDDDSIVYSLTSKGLKLWHERSEEEAQSPPPRPKAEPHAKHHSTGFNVWLYQGEHDASPTRVGSFNNQGTLANLQSACKKAIEVLQKGENDWFTEVEEPMSGDVYETYYRFAGTVLNKSTNEVVG